MKYRVEFSMYNPVPDTPGQQGITSVVVFAVASSMEEAMENAKPVVKGFTCRPTRCEEMS